MPPTPAHLQPVVPVRAGGNDTRSHAHLQDIMAGLHLHLSVLHTFFLFPILTQNLAGKEILGIMALA